MGAVFAVFRCAAPNIPPPSDALALRRPSPRTTVRRGTAVDNGPSPPDPDGRGCRSTPGWVDRPFSILAEALAVWRSACSPGGVHHPDNLRRTRFQWRWCRSIRLVITGSVSSRDQGVADSRRSGCRVAPSRFNRPAPGRPLRRAARPPSLRPGTSSARSRRTCGRGRCRG